MEERDFLVRTRTMLAKGLTEVRNRPRIISLLVAALLLWNPTEIVQAQPAPWKSEKGYENGIPIGTKITQANWQRYQQFMTEGMKAVFAGTYFWHMPRNVEIDVGPTRPIPAPKPYLQDTEKYSSQVTLEPLPDGGYVPKGYVAGFPFSNPLKGDAALIAERIYWNTFYRRSARVEEAPNCSYLLDMYGNFTRSADVNAVNSQLQHLSEPGFPRDEPDAGGYWFAAYGEQTAPEQGKYSGGVILSPNDPTQLDEEYLYVPSLRRSFRVSQAARCAPVFGTDFTLEDIEEGPPRQGQLFKKEYLGTKKILTLLHAAPESFDTCGTPTTLDPRYYYAGSKGIVPFPSAGSGQWEVRDVYVIKLTRLPKHFVGYCYGKRILYLDKENYFSTNADLWDMAGNLYKWIAVFAYPGLIPGLGLDGQLVTITGPNTGYIVNFQDQHATVFIGLHVCVDRECAKRGYLDISRYASPEGLMKIQQ
jgi:hypothetical protein